MTHPLEKRRQSCTLIPIGIEKLLYRAATDLTFRDALLDHPRQTIAAAGYCLQASEQQVMESVSRDQLAAMIARIDPKRHGQRPFMRTIAAVAVAAVTTTTVSCGPPPLTGIAPDRPPVDLTEAHDESDDAATTAAPRPPDGPDAPLPEHD